jgi:sortase A
MKLRVRLPNSRHSSRRRTLSFLANVLFVAGCLTLGLPAFVYVRAVVFQAHEKQQFERSREPASVDRQELDRADPLVSTSDSVGPRLPARRHGLAHSTIGRIEIPRLGLSVMVLDSVTPRALRLGAGHIPGTALPGEPGNAGIAGHRDTFFRKLGELHDNDAILVTTQNAAYRYSVESVRVVDPSDVSVLRPSSEPTLTLVTCYPFYFVGPAPKRFVVRAQGLPDVHPAMKYDKRK